MASVSDIISLAEKFPFPKYDNFAMDFRIEYMGNILKIFIPGGCLEIKLYPIETKLITYIGHHWQLHAKYFMHSNFEQHAKCRPLLYLITNDLDNATYKQFYDYMQKVLQQVAPTDYSQYIVHGNYVVRLYDDIVGNIYNCDTQMFENKVNGLSIGDIYDGPARKYNHYSHAMCDIKFELARPRAMFFDHEVLYGYTPDGLTYEVRRDDPPTSLTDFVPLFATREEVFESLF